VDRDALPGTIRIKVRRQRRIGWACVINFVIRLSRFDSRALNPVNSAKDPVDIRSFVYIPIGKFSGFRARTREALSPSRSSFALLTWVGSICPEYRVKEKHGFSVTGKESRQESPRPIEPVKSVVLRKRSDSCFAKGEGFDKCQRINKYHFPELIRN